MSTQLVLLIAYFLPFLLVLRVMPVISAMGKRLNINEMSAMDSPVSVMGGMVVTAVVCATLLALSAFVNLDKIFPAICMIVCLFIMGMLEDSVRLHTGTKLVFEISVLLVIIFCGRFRIDDFCGLFGINQLNYAWSALVSLLSGLLIVNAVRMFNGIDGLLSGVTTFSSFAVGIWCTIQGQIDFAVLSFVISGSLLWMFVFSTCSQRFKVYLGHSGALVIGVYMFLAFCMGPAMGTEEGRAFDPYFIGFLMSVFSAPLFDVIRVMFFRLIQGRSPFAQDRAHIYYSYEDIGLSGPVVVLLMMLSSMFVTLVWFVTTKLGMDQVVQFWLIVLLGILLFWVPSMRHRQYFKYRTLQYQKYSIRAKRVSVALKPIFDKIAYFVDQVIYSRVERSVAEAEEKE